MRKLIALILAAMVAPAVQAATVFYAAYGVQNEFPFEIWSSDGLTLDADESDDGNDALVSCNAGDSAESTNTYTDEGSRYQIVLTATEMQCEYITVEIVEAVNTVFYIQTYGNASARVISQPIAAPGAADGMLIAGTNADLNVTGNVALADGLTITRSSSNLPGLAVTGNGTGNGATFTSGSGATGNGVLFIAVSTNGHGVEASGTGAGSGLLATGGATGDGFEGTGGGTSGTGLRSTATAGNTPGVIFTGQGSGAGLFAVGGATGAGSYFAGGGTSGPGLRTSGSGGNSHGIEATGNGSGSGISATSNGTGNGALFTGGSTSGAGFAAAAAAGNSTGATFTGQGTGNGATFTSGSGATGTGLQVTSAATNGSGLGLTGNGTGSGFNGTFSATSLLTWNAAWDAEVESEVDDSIGSGTGTSLTAIPWNANWDTEVQSEANDALVAYDPPTNAEMEARTIVAANYFDPAADTVLLSTAVGNCVAPLGCSEEGTLSGTHSATTADLGTNAPGATSDLVGKTLFIPAKFFSRQITAYDTGTGVATFATTALTLANGDQWYLYETAPGSGGDGGDGSGFTAIPWNSSWDAEVESEVDDALGGGTGTALTAIPWNPSWDAEVESEVDDSIGGGTGTSLTGIPWDADWDADVQSEVQDAIEANHLDHLLAVDYDPASKPGVATALLNELIESDVGVSQFTANALEEAPTGAGGDGSAFTSIPWNPAWDAEVESEVDDALGSGTGAALTAIPWNAAWDAEVESEVDDALGGGTGTALTAIPWNANWDSEAQSEAADALVAYDPSTGAEIAALNNLSSAQAQAAAQTAIQIELEQATLADANDLICTVNDANTTPTTTLVPCILTDRDGGAVTSATDRMQQREIIVMSGALRYERRNIVDSSWANSELTLTLDRALGGALADGVTVLIE